MKRSICVLLALLMLLCGFMACNEEKPQVESTVESDPPLPEGHEPDTSSEYEIIKDGQSEYYIVFPENVTKGIQNCCKNLSNLIKAECGVKIPLKDDWYKEGIQPYDPESREILVGNTNRTETQEFLNSLPENSYGVKISEKKIVIVGKDNNLTMLAFRDFMKDLGKIKEGSWIVTEGMSFTVTFEEPLTVEKMFKEKMDITCSSKQVVHTPIRGDQRIGQGVASDGTYVYFVLRDSGDTGSVITKHRLDTGAFVAASEILDLGHGNDMTYDSKNKRLVVAHGQSEGQILTLVDADTLAFIKNINIPKGSGAITYNEKRDQYAISQGGKTLYILDSDFKLVASYTRKDSTGYTPQGMGSDDDLIYFPMSGKDDNLLVVYDWKGKYLGTITVPVDHESESMFCVNGKYYIAYNTNGEALYETSFELIY